MNSHKKAFTLIELLIVIAIIGILMVALLPTITAGPARARDAARIKAVNDIVAALELIVVDGGTYPAQTAVTAASCLDFTTGIGVTIRDNMGKVPTVTPVSSNALCTTGQFFYKSGIDNASYMVAVQLETPGSANLDTTAITTGNLTSTALSVRAYSSETAILDATDGTIPTEPIWFYVIVK